MDITAWTGLPVEIIALGICSWTLIQLVTLIVGAIKDRKAVAAEARQDTSVG